MPPKGSQRNPNYRISELRLIGEIYRKLCDKCIKDNLAKSLKITDLYRHVAEIFILHAGKNPGRFHKREADKVIQKIRILKREGRAPVTGVGTIPEYRQMILESDTSTFIATGGRVLSSYNRHGELVEPTGEQNRASLDMNKEVEQESIDKETNPIVLDLEIFLEYYVRRVKTLKSSSEGKSTKKINKDVVALTTKNRGTKYTVEEREIVTEPEDTVDLTPDPEEGASSPNSSFSLLDIGSSDLKMDREDPLKSFIDTSISSNNVNRQNTELRLELRRAAERIKVLKLVNAKLKSKLKAAEKTIISLRVAREVEDASPFYNETLLEDPVRDNDSLMELFQNFKIEILKTMDERIGQNTPKISLTTTTATTASISPRIPATTAPEPAKLGRALVKSSHQQLSPDKRSFKRTRKPTSKEIYK